MVSSSSLPTTRSSATNRARSSARSSQTDKKADRLVLSAFLFANHLCANHQQVPFFVPPVSRPVHGNGPGNLLIRPGDGSDAWHVPCMVTRDDTEARREEDFNEFTSSVSALRALTSRTTRLSRQGEPDTVVPGSCKVTPDLVLCPVARTIFFDAPLPMIRISSKRPAQRPWHPHSGPAVLPAADGSVRPARP